MTMYLERLLQVGIGGTEPPPGPPTGGASGAASRFPGDGGTAADSPIEVFSTALDALTADVPHDGSESAELGAEIGAELLGIESSPITTDTGVPAILATTDIGILAADNEVSSNVVGGPGSDGARDAYAAVTALPGEIEGLVPANAERSVVESSSADRPGAGAVVVGGATPPTTSTAGLTEVLASGAASDAGARSGPALATGPNGSPNALPEALDAGDPASGAGTTKPQESDVATLSAPKSDVVTLSAPSTAQTVTSEEEATSTPDRIASGAGGTGTGTGTVGTAVSTEGAPRGSAPEPGGPRTAPEIEVAARTPSAATVETRTATRQEGSDEPTILAAIRGRAETRAAGESAGIPPRDVAGRVDTVAAPRSIASTADAIQTADVREGVEGRAGESSGLVAALESEQARTGSTPLRAGADQSIAPALQLLAREAAQRQRVQAAVAPVPGVTAGDAEAGGTTQAPGMVAPATGSMPTSVMARIDQPQGFSVLAERIVDALHLSAARGGSEIRLHVEPKGLGPIDVRVQLQEDGVRATIVAEHEATRVLIRSQQHLLEAALGRSDLKLSGFSVDVSLGQEASQFHDTQQGGDSARSTGHEHARGDVEPADDRAPSVSTETGRLSLRV